MQHRAQFPLRAVTGILLGLPLLPGVAFGQVAAGQTNTTAPKPPAAVKRPVINPRLPKETQAQQLALFAEELQEKGKLAEAAEILREAAELTPQDWNLWETTGWAYLDSGQAAPALKAFEAAQKAAPKGAVLSGGALIAHFGLGNRKELLELVSKSVGPDLASAAAAVIEKGLAARPRSADWSFALGYLYVRVLGNRARALQPLEAVVAATPANADAWLYLVEVNQELSRGQKEDAAAIKYLELAPETADAYRIRAERYAVISKLGEAAAEYLAGIQKYPTTPELHFALSRIYERAGRPKEAEETLSKLVALAETRKLDALKLNARTQLAAYQARHRNYPPAEAFYRELVQRADAPAANWSNWAALLALTGKWPEAAKAYSTAADREEESRGKADPQARENLLIARYRAGVAWLAAGQKETAKTSFLAAQGLKAEAHSTPEIEATAFLTWIATFDKGEALAYAKSDERWAAFVWRPEQDPGEVEIFGKYSTTATAWRAVLQQVQKIQRDCWPADYALARVYAAAGFTEDALSLLRRVCDSRPTWWAPYYAVGHYHAVKRDKDEGVPALRKALQLAPACRQARSLLSRLSAVPDDDL